MVFEKEFTKERFLKALSFLVPKKTGEIAEEIGCGNTWVTRQLPSFPEVGYKEIRNKGRARFTRVWWIWVTPELVDQLNVELASRDFEEVIKAYGLTTPVMFELGKAREIQKWGCTEDGKVLLYGEDGFYLVPETEWKEKVKNECKSIVSDPSHPARKI